MRQVMPKSQEFMKERHSAKDGASVEWEARLGFLSFLKPIVNGKGFMWKEPVTGDERRMDVVITYGASQKEVVELKVWRGEEYHRQGLGQLAAYLDFQGVGDGFLLVFDFRKDKEFKSEQIKFGGRGIFAVWV